MFLLPPSLTTFISIIPRLSQDIWGSHLDIFSPFSDILQNKQLIYLSNKLNKMKTIISCSPAFHSNLTALISVSTNLLNLQHYQQQAASTAHAAHVQPCNKAKAWPAANDWIKRIWPLPFIKILALDMNMFFGSGVQRQIYKLGP